MTFLAVEYRQTVITKHAGILFICNMITTQKCPYEFYEKTRSV